MSDAVQDPFPERPRETPGENAEDDAGLAAAVSVEGRADEDLEGMGVSSERTGPVGPDGEPGTTGVRPTVAARPEPGEEPPEERPGNEETNPVGIPPKPPHLRPSPGQAPG